MIIEKFKNGNANANELWDLRNQISLNSLYASDYENSYGLDVNGLINFFDGYLEELEYLMSYNDDYSSDKFFELLDDYDTSDNLYDYYSTLDVETLKALFS